MLLCLLLIMAYYHSMEIGKKATKWLKDNIRRVRRKKNETEREYKGEF